MQKLEASIKKLEIKYDDLKEKHNKKINKLEKLLTPIFE